MEFLEIFLYEHCEQSVYLDNFQKSYSLRFPYCSYGESTLAKKVLLVGDSHANHFAQALGVAAVNQNLTLMLWTQSGCVLQFESNYGK